MLLPKWDKKLLMSQDRMELWSNSRLTEFAINFNSVIVVTTSHNLETMNVLTELAMKLIGIIRFHSGLFIIWQTNLLFYLIPKLQYQKSSIFETKKLSLVHTILPILPSR